MHRPLILLALPLLGLAACDMKVGREEEAAGGNGSAGNIAAAGDESGHVSLDIPGFSAKIAIPAFDSAGRDMDIDGIELYPGSRVTGVDIRGGRNGGQDNVRISYVNPDAPEKLKAYYEAAGRDHGFTVNPSTEEGAATVLHLTNAEGKAVHIAIEPDAAGSKGAVTIID